jgi:hypothetical protein
VKLVFSGSAGKLLLDGAILSSRNTVTFISFLCVFILICYLLSVYIYINNSFVSFRLSLYSYDLLDLCNVLFLMNFEFKLSVILSGGLLLSFFIY